MRLLAVNADDFGFTRDVNEGIVHAHRFGIVTSTTLMANGPAFDHAVSLSRENPELDVGAHLTLVGGRSAQDPNRKLPGSVRELLGALLSRSLDVEAEFEAQIQKILDAGILPSHLDTHKHTHLLPSVLEVVARLARRLGIVWVRRPLDMPTTAGEAALGKRLVSRSLSLLRGRFHRALEAQGCRTTDHFAGFQMTGKYGAEDLVNLIRHLPEGVTEFMCHPGYCTEELRAAPTRLKESRERELAALTDAEVKASLRQARVRLVRFRELHELTFTQAWEGSADKPSGG